MKQWKEWLSRPHPKKTSDSPSKTRLSTPKDHVVCMVRLGRHNSLRTTWAQPNTNADNYVAHLHKLNEPIQQKLPKRPNGVLLQQESGRPYIANMTKAMIQELEWKEPLHLPYSPDFAWSSYSIALWGVSFNNEV